MAEDEEPKPAEPEALQPAAPAPVEPRVDDAVAAPPATPPAPPNKLHEWGAALGIMVFLAFVLWVFLNFLRSSSM